VKGLQELRNGESDYFSGSFGLIAGIYVIHGLILLFPCGGQQEIKHGLARR